MTCTLCIKYRRELTDNGSNIRGQGTFIQGSTNLKKFAVDDHETSKGHLKAVELENAAKRTATDVLKAGKALQKLREAERNRLNTLFRNAHALMKQNRPLSDFVWMCKLDIMKDLDIGNTYFNNKAALEFVKCIASAERQNTCRMLENVNYFTLIMDGTTDISGDEQEAVYVRFFKDGIICERYLGMGTPESTCSADLFQFLMDLFRANEIDTGMASDGASNMVGKKSGLAALVRINVNDEILNLHCFAHRMKLAFRDVFKKHKLYDKVMTMLIGICYFYHKQDKNKKGLLRMIDAVKIKGVMPSKVTGTRWLPHLSRGIRNFLTTFKAFEAHLATISHTNPKAEKIYKSMTSKGVLCFIFFLKEILDQLMRVSLKLQRPETSVAECSTWVASTVDLLEDYKSRDFKEVDELLTSGKCQGISLRGNTPSFAYKETIIDGLIEALKERFSLNDTTMNVFKATVLHHPPSWSDSDKLTEFGEKEISAVGDHFKSSLQRADPDFTTETAILEFRLLKKILYKEYGEAIHSSKWGEMLTHGKEFPSFMLVFEVLGCFPLQVCPVKLPFHN